MSTHDYNLVTSYFLRRLREDDDKYQSRMDSIDDTISSAMGRLEDAGYEMALNHRKDWIIKGRVGSSPDIDTPRTEGGSASATAVTTDIPVITPPVIDIDIDNESRSRAADFCADDLLDGEGGIASLHSLNAKRKPYPPGSVRIVLDKYIDLRSCVVDIADQMLLFEEMKFPVVKEDKGRFFLALFQAETVSTVAG